MTGTEDWRVRRWAATHRRIFTAALALFEDFGFEQVSVGQIATAASVSVPTFYAHYPSKEHLIMALPTAEQVEALLASQPGELSVGEKIRRAAPLWFASMPPDEYEETLLRWRIIAGTPSLRRRAAEFERETAGMIVGALPTSGTAEVVQAGAYLAAFTTALLAWADSGGERKLDEVFDEAFGALGG